MKKHNSHIIVYFVLLGLLLTNIVDAQPNLTQDGQNHIINYNNNDRVQEYRIPSSLSSGLIYFEATGGDGGRKRNGSLISGKGGQGARMGAWFEIGTGSNQIPPGSEIVFIIGERGESINNAWAESAGGGGGTAIFYKRPDNQYTLLLVAGGGNGGYSDCCTVKEDGNPGEIIQCPISGTDSYCSFTYLACGCYCTAGGGGIYDPSRFYYYDVQNTKWQKCNSKTAGHLGWPGATNPYTNPVKPTGGEGGNWDVIGNSQLAVGGFGFGGGAGGGGVGITQPNGGGFTPGGKEKDGVKETGGGSFINNMHHKNRSTLKEKRGSTNSSQSGQITYRIIPSAPNVVCNNLTIYLDEYASATVQASEIGAGSSDPNGFQLAYTLYDINNQPLGSSIDLTCSDIASPLVVNLVGTSLLDGTAVDSSTCSASITIKARPTVTCKDATVQLNTNSQAFLRANNINYTTTTICGETISSYTLSKSSFGCTDVGSHTVTLTAIDNNGDRDSCTANVQVNNPNTPIVRCKDITIDLGMEEDVSISLSDIYNGTDNVCTNISYANYPQGYSISTSTFDCSKANTTQTVTITLNAPGGSISTCNSQVRIERNLSQFAKCKDITVTLDESGEVRLKAWRGQNIDDDSYDAFIPCLGRIDGVYELSKELFTCADIGPNSVTLTIKKDGQFIDDCTGTVTVIDQAGPIVNCKPITVQMPSNELGEINISPTDFLEDYHDPCGGIRNARAWAPTKRPASDVQYTLTINSDYWPSETSWSLTSGGKTFFSGGPYNITSGSIITETFSLSPGRYTFNIYDEYGDGLNSIPPNQMTGFRLEDEFGKLIIESEPNDWDYQKSKNFYAGDNIYTDIVTFRCEDVGGTYPVRVIVYDNYRNGSTCETTVTIEQDLSDAAKCKDVVVTLDQSGQNQIHTKRGSGGLDFDNGSTISSCEGGHTFVLTPDQTIFNYSCADIGANPVTLSLTKPNGDIIDECISTVMVQDKAGPVAKCQPLTIQLPSSGTTTLTGTDLDAGSYDVCGTIASMQVWNSNSNPYSEKEFALTIQFEFFSTDNSWTLTSGENTYASGGPYTYAEDLKLITETFSLPPGCYELNFYDSHGDGFRFSGPGNGYFQLKDDQGNILVEGADDWDYQKSGNFCVEENAFSNFLTFDCASIGTHPVGLLLKDNYGNGSVCNTTVTVEDNSSSTLACQDVVIPMNDKGIISITVYEIIDPSTSICGFASLDLDKTSFDCSNFGENTVTLTAILPDGNSSFCTAKVTISDPEYYCNLPPVAVCKNVTMSVDQNCEVYLTYADVDGGSYDLDEDNLIMNMDKTTFGPGTHSVILTVSDGTYTDQCTALVTVNDVSKPVPIIASLSPIDGECEAIVYEKPGATDNCGQIIFGTTNDPLTYTEQGEYTITWTFDDGNGNIETATQLVVVKDYFKPIPDIPSLPTIRAECSATVPAPTATDFCAGIITGTTNDPISFNQQGTYIINWTFDDGNGNVETQTQTVIVDDVTKPIPDLTTLPTITGECLANVDRIPTATDACEGSIQGTTSDPLTYSTQGTHSITWSFDDGNGNVETQTQTVIVDDVTKPTPDLATLPTITNECPVTVSPPTATDYCSGNAIIGTTSDPLTYSTLGTHTITWSFDDGNGNIETQTQIVIVVDNTPPIAKCKDLKVPVDANGKATVSAQDLDNGSTDNCGSLTFEFSDGSTKRDFMCSASGFDNFDVTLIVKDNNGNQSTCFSFVTPIDNLPPIARCKDVTIELDAAGKGNYSIKSVDDGSFDNCGLAIIFFLTMPLDCSDIGSFEVTYPVIDVSQNESSCTGMITVVDRVAPDAKCREATVVVDENGQGTVTVQQVDNGSSDACGIQSMSLDKTTISCSDQTVTLTVTDIYNNSNSCTANLILKDNIAPIPNVATLPTITGNCEAGLEPPFATDNCAGQVMGTTADPLYFDKVGIYTITWVYDDGNGNTSSQDQTIIIEDDVAPVPDRNNLPTLRAQCGLTVSTIPTATDRCVGTIQGTTSDPLTYNTQGIHIITWVYDDGNENSVTQTQRVVIRDTKAPVPDQPNLPALTGSCSVIITHFPTATDNCVGSITATTDSPLEFDQEGTFVVLWNYDDGNGNISTQTQWVMVGGNAAPNALCKNISMPMTGNGTVNISASDIDDGSFDDCSQVTLLISPAGGSIFGTGLPPAPSMDIHCVNGKEQNLLLSVTNEKGSTAYCQAKVTLEGTDSDADGLLDSCDNCPDTYNLNQKDSNNNGTGDACEQNSNPDPSPGGWGGWSLKKQGQEENSSITELKAFPNPFQEEVNLSFNLSQEEKTTIEIFNIQGQRIHTLLSEMVPAGDHRILWDGKDQNGQPMPAGIYLVRLRAGKALINQKVILQK